MSLNRESKDNRRQRIIEDAVDAANRVIDGGSDGSVEETNYLTAQAAKKLMETALIPFSHKLRDYDWKARKEAD